MAAHIILVTPEEEVDGLANVLRTVDTTVDLASASSLEELRARAAARPDTRLIGFCTPLIVPADVLDALTRPAYNFHPGPPEYPGLFPAVFALYDGAGQFGATCHEMTAEVDGGAIVGVTRCDIRAETDRLNLEALSRQLVAHLFTEMAPALVYTETPLQPVGEAWGTPVRRRADFDALCQLPDDVDAAEFERRLRAVGEGPNHALRINLHGRHFRIENTPSDGRVYVGGRPR